MTDFIELTEDMTIGDMAKIVHADNVAAGWWTDIKTGASIVETRNRPEMLMLMVSELGEAVDAIEVGAMDDKLPQYNGFNVELADFIIRGLDLFGAETNSNKYGQKLYHYDRFDVAGFSVSDVVMVLVRKIAQCMEFYRKGDTSNFVDHLWLAISLGRKIGSHNNTDLFEIINAKRRYNANRADHKIENRLKSDGKKF